MHLEEQCPRTCTPGRPPAASVRRTTARFPFRWKPRVCRFLEGGAHRAPATFQVSNRVDHRCLRTQLDTHAGGIGPAMRPFETGQLPLDDPRDKLARSQSAEPSTAALAGVLLGAVILGALVCALSKAPSHTDTDTTVSTRMWCNGGNGLLQRCDD